MSQNETLIELIRSQNRQTAAAREMPTLDPVYPSPSATLLDLPRVVAAWPMSSVAVGLATVRDIAGEGLHLTNNNSTPFEFAGAATYGNYTAASSHYLSRTHAAAIAPTGSTWWTALIYPTVAAGSQGIISKWVSATNQSWRLFKNTSDQLVFQLSNLGTAIDASVTTSALTMSKWYHIFVVYLTSTSLTIWVNGTATTSTTTIPASLFNATGADLEVGRTNAGNYWSGRIGGTAFGRVAAGTALADWEQVARRAFGQVRWTVGL